MMRILLATLAVFFLIYPSSKHVSAQLEPATEDDALIRLALSAIAAAAPALEQEVLGDVLELCSATPIPEPTPVLQQPPENIQRVAIDNAEIAYLRFGNATSDRSPLIVIPGYSSTLASIPRTILLELSKDQEIIAIDNRGQGLSTDYSPPGTPLTIEGMANDTAAFISALNLTDPNVLGISMGGMIASALATNHGDSFGLIVVAHGSAGGNGIATPPANQSVAVLTEENWNTTAVLDTIYNLSAPRGVESACESYFNAIANPILSPENITTTQRQTEAIRQWFLGPGVYARLPSVTNPMLLVGGLNDTVVPVGNVRVMADALPDAWLAIFPGKHAAYIEYGDSFVEIFETFYDVYGVAQ